MGIERKMPVWIFEKILNCLFYDAERNSFFVIMSNNYLIFRTL